MNVTNDCVDADCDVVYTAGLSSLLIAEDEPEDVQPTDYSVLSSAVKQEQQGTARPADDSKRRRHSHVTGLLSSTSSGLPSTITGLLSSTSTGLPSTITRLPSSASSGLPSTITGLPSSTSSGLPSTGTAADTSRPRHTLLPRMSSSTYPYSDDDDDDCGE